MSHVVSLIVSFTHNFGKSTGILSTTELNWIWKQFIVGGKGNEGEKEVSVDKLIDILVKLEFAHRLPISMLNSRTTTNVFDDDSQTTPSEQFVLVPHLLPVQRPSISSVWPRIVVVCDPSESQHCEWGRTFLFPFLPIGFFGKLVTRLLHFPVLTKVFWWQSGLVLKVNNNSNNNNSNNNTISPPVSELSSHSPSPTTIRHSPITMKQEIILVELLERDGTKKSLVIRMRTNNKTVDDKTIDVESIKVFSQVIDTVENLLEGFYPKLATKITRLVPCTHCLSQQQQNIPVEIYHFSQEQCVSVLLSGQKYCLCNDIPTRRVPFHELIPDLSLSNICSISMKEITRLKDLGKGGFGVVCMLFFYFFFYLFFLFVVVVFWSLIISIMKIFNFTFWGLLFVCFVITLINH